MRFFLGVFITALFAITASAQPWYARGEFNGYDTSAQMLDMGGGFYTRTLDGFFGSTPYEYKIGNTDFSQSAPGSNGKIWTNAAGSMTFNFWDQTSWSDGWLPNNNRRVGYTDPGVFGWEIVGSFDNWPDTNNPTYALTNMGNGLYHGQFTFQAGTYQYKFRHITANQTMDPAWSTSIGNDFGNSAGDNQITVLANGDKWNFDLDLPNGRLRATPLIDPDHNGDGKVNAADYVTWRKNPNAHGGDPAGYNVWRTNFGLGYEWYARGSWNGFGLTNRMVDQGGGHYTAQITGLTPGTDYDYKLARANFSEAYPGSNGKVRADASGNINFHLYEKPGAGWTDGWSPANANRAGYNDPNQYGWEIVGAFNGWPNTNDPNYALTNQGNGLYTGTFSFATPGAYDFKFRHITADQTMDPAWNTSIGDDFGNAAANNSFTVASAGQMWSFQLDLPHGRWRAFAASGASLSAVPEPASFALVMLGLACLMNARRRK